MFWNNSILPIEKKMHWDRLFYLIHYGVCTAMSNRHELPHVELISVLTPTRFRNPWPRWLMMTSGSKIQYFYTVFRISDFNIARPENPSCWNPTFLSRKSCFSTHTTWQHSLPVPEAVHPSDLELNVTHLHLCLPHPCGCLMNIDGTYISLSRL